MVFLELECGLAIITKPWGISSAGRARPSQGRGRRFDPAMLHQRKLECTVRKGRAFLLFSRVILPLSYNENRG